MLAVSALRSVSVEQYVASLPIEEQEVARHVLLGGFNKRGDPVGFHHAPNGVAPLGRRIDHVVRSFPDRTYQARISIWDERRGWVPKLGVHTMFPDQWSLEGQIYMRLRSGRTESGRETPASLFGFEEVPLGDERHGWSRPLWSRPGAGSDRAD